LLDPCLLFFKSSAIYQKWSPQGNSKELPSYKSPVIIICSRGAELKLLSFERSKFYPDSRREE